MILGKDQSGTGFDPRFKIFHELMSKKVREILLISTPYEAWIMEEDSRLSEQIINEYRGLNLSNPPRLHWVSSPEEALSELEKQRFDLVIIVSRAEDQDVFGMANNIKSKAPEVPMMLLSHQVKPSLECLIDQTDPEPFDRIFMWTGNTDLLLALIKNAEDQMNVAHDTTFAGIRVIIFVEDSPEFTSAILPILYKELVLQTQAVMESGLTQEHRLLAMRARPKILVAEAYEEALNLFKQYGPYVLGVISDTRIPRDCKLDESAGIELLKRIRSDRFDIPLMLISTEPENSENASKIPAVFVDKNSSSLLSEIRSFVTTQLGFGDFIFRMPDGNEIGRAPDLHSLEQNIREIPDEAFALHSDRNDFSRWLFAHSEIELASRVRPLREEDFSSVEDHRQYILSNIHARRMQRQKGIVVNFDSKVFDTDTEFFKIGTGSLGGKARGLAFFAGLLGRTSAFQKQFEGVQIVIPQTLVITSDGFDEFTDSNKLKYLANEDLPDEDLAREFLKARFPEEIKDKLKEYLRQVKYPLAVRSSSLLEDARFRAYAGLYKTYMLPNDHPDLECRLDQLINAIKMVYASTYFEGPKSFSRRVGHRIEEEKMAIIIQKVVGERYGDYVYPAISGIAQSHNFYPFSKMKPEDGIATIALGLGKSVMEGEKALRFSPKYPELLPQRSTVDDILENSQRHFYAIKMDEPLCPLGVNDRVTLMRREVIDAEQEPPIKAIAGMYIPEEHRIRDSAHGKGYRVLTFSQILKYDLFPLAEILREILSIGQEGMGCPVEIEFSVDLRLTGSGKPQFAVLQIRPMTAREDLMHVDIDENDLHDAFCVSTQALGNTTDNSISDIVYVRPDVFDPAHTREIAQQIKDINSILLGEGRKYILVGPGRWGSNDQWLGIPVSWPDICGVGAIVEASHPLLKAEPSQGSHFFHNITSLGISYLTVKENQIDRIDWDWLMSLPITTEYPFVSHSRLDKSVILKVNGRQSIGVLLFHH